jgi:hypothetical protein
VPAPPNAFCPHCGQRAPIVLRGIEARCTACGGARIPFTARSLNLAGQPSRIGGTAATVAGWAVLAVGLFVATLVTLLLNALPWPPAGVIGWILGIAIALLAIVIGGGLLFGGHKLRKHGSEKRHSVRLEAVQALAAHRGGQLTAAQAAGSLDVSEAEADAILTDLAKNPDANVSLEIDDAGGIHYLFGKGGDERWRILAETDAASRAAEDEAAAAEAEEAELAGRRAKQ